MAKQIGLLAILAFGFMACNDEKVESEDIRTSGIYAAFHVLATGNDKTTATSELRVGGDSGTIIILTGEDKLVCTATVPELAPTTKTLSKDGNEYKATFSGDAASTQFLFAFNRSDEDETAPDSHVVLPDPFTISGVAPTDEISRAASLSVTWDPSETKDATTWSLDGDCLFKSDGTVPDDGALTLSGSDFNSTPSADDAAKAGDSAKANCTATLCIEKKRHGTLDPAFAREEGGVIDAIQRRCTQFISTP
ncbi:MAG TPA: hypothetical protein VIV60_22725 [Polyangiaceae bacterium]